MKKLLGIKILLKIEMVMVVGPFYLMETLIYPYQMTIP
jgi:hypothetical protein